MSEIALRLHKMATLPSRRTRAGCSCCVRDGTWWSCRRRRARARTRARTLRAREVRRWGRRFSVLLHSILRESFESGMPLGHRARPPRGQLETEDHARPVAHPPFSPRDSHPLPYPFRHSPLSRFCTLLVLVPLQAFALTDEGILLEMRRVAPSSIDPAPSKYPGVVSLARALTEAVRCLQAPFSLCDYS